MSIKVLLPSPSHPVTFSMCFNVFNNACGFCHLGVWSTSPQSIQCSTAEITATSCFTCFDLCAPVKCEFATIFMNPSYDAVCF